MNIHMTTIDPQNDFLDDGALGVPNGRQAIKNVANIYRNMGPKIALSTVSMDAHPPLHIANNTMLNDKNGDEIAPYTVITEEAIINNEIFVRKGDQKPAILDGLSIREYFLHYLRQLKASPNQHPLIAWPRHCQIGSSGSNIQEDLYNELQEWCVNQYRAINYITKGSCMWTEHYGALEAEVTFAGDDSTQLNLDQIKLTTQFDLNVYAGLASSHCLMATCNQVFNNVGADQLKRMVILTDCTAPVPKTGDQDFPAMADDWLKHWKQRGVTLMDSKEFIQRYGK
jgi:nicotinamidase-related amidase